MGQMIRKQVYIEANQDEVIKQRARMLGVTEAEVIRRAIDRQVNVPPSRTRDLAAWEREKEFISRRMAETPAVSRRRRFRREEAYEERLNRYGR